MTISHPVRPVHQTRPRLHARRGVESMPLHKPSESYRFVAPRRGRAVIAAMLLAGVVLTGMAAVVAVSQPSRGSFLATCLSAIAVVGLWAAMQARLPQTVTLKNSVIEISGNGHVERFDLVDPSVEVLARDGEIAFRCYDGRFAVVRSRDVDWKEFTHVVMHYQTHADRKAEERKSRFTR